MINLLRYFFQATIIYFCFIVGKLIGITLSRIVFSSIFNLIGPLFKSKKIIKQNLNIFETKVSGINKNVILEEMWKNYGKTFIEYMFLNNLR